MPPHWTLPALFLGLTSAPALSQSAVLVVDAANAPGTDFTSIGAAIAAASDGDQVLVRDGVYPEDLLIAGKSLTVQADEPGLVFVQSVAVQDVLSGGVASIRGLVLRNLGSEPDHALRIENCQGPVWLDEIVVEDMRVELGAGLIRGCASVSLTRCSVDGPKIAASGRPPAFLLDQASTYISDSQIQGADGFCDQLAGIEIRGGYLGLYDSAVAGNPGTGFCILGGPALYLSSGDPVVQAQDSTLTSVVAKPVYVQSGSFEDLPSEARSHGTSSPVYDDGALDVTFEGKAGDQVWVYVSSSPSLGLVRTFFDVAFLLAPPLTRIPIGTLPASGSASFSIPIGDLGPGTIGRVVYSQALFFEPGGSPAFVFSEPSVLHFLDASLHDPEYILPFAPDWTGSRGAGVSFGELVAGAGDVNGDGYDDVLVGDPRTQNPMESVGAAYAYYGSASGLSAVADWGVRGTHIWPGSFPTVVEAAGDVNGDGYDDVIVLDAGFGTPSAAYVYHGSPSGLTEIEAWSVQEDPNNRIGRSAASAGDVNGDGYDDVLIGTTSPFGSSWGSIWVFHGSPNGLSAAPDLTLPNPTSVFSGLTFGACLASAGDVNGDGYDDVVASAPDLSRPLSIGPVYVFLGSPSGLSATPSWNAAFGRSVSSADVNGDGFDDLLTGKPGFSSWSYGAVFEQGCIDVFHGAAAGLSATADASVCSGIEFSELGFVVSGAGDLDGDGYEDVVASASGFTHPEPNEGAAFVYAGSPAGLRAAPVWRFESDIPDTITPFRGLSAVDGAGDVNGDGRSDIVLGLPNATSPVGGCAHAFYGIP